MLCAIGECDYKQQHWIEMLALLRQNSIMPSSGLLHRVRRYYDFCSNIGCFAFAKWAKQNFHHEYDCQSSQNMCDHIFQLLEDKGHLGHVRLWRTIEGKRTVGVDCIGELTHCGLVTLYGDIYLGQYFSGNGLLLDGIKPFPEPSRYWFKWRLVANLGNLD